MIDYSPLYARLEAKGLAAWVPLLRQQVAERLDPARHGDLERWRGALEALPAIEARHVDLNADALLIEPALDPAARAALVPLLQQFHPWRKGPFSIHGIRVETEWRSDWKWNRLKGAVDLRDKDVLDVGCGNGYYGWRMVGAGARMVMGIDPTLLYVMQFAALRHFIGPAANFVLPLRLEELPAGCGAFDVVFSMGVLYHRRVPLEHLRRLRAHLKTGGELVLETLVIDGGPGDLLVPGERYAKMKNVWGIPSVPTAMAWLASCGFNEVRCIDVTRTTPEEQRSTPWMRFESLPDFLDPADPLKTCEGHPAPVRAVLTARA